MPRTGRTRGLVIVPALLLLLLASAAGCTGATTAQRPRSDVRQEPAYRTDDGSSTEAPSGVPAVTRQIARDGRMRVEVADLAAAHARFDRAASALGAEVARLDTEDDERSTYRLRVPADRLEALMDSAAALGGVQTRSVSAQDVTDRMVDAEARLGALRASRDRLRQLLERASTVQEVVTVERELARVQGEVESLEGRLAALRGQVARSDLELELRQRTVLGPLGYVVRGLATVIGKLFVWR